MDCARFLVFFLIFIAVCAIFVFEMNEMKLTDVDKNVYFIPGPELMAIAKNEGMVENTHPNDLGMFFMTQAVEKVLKKYYLKERGYEKWN